MKGKNLIQSTFLLLIPILSFGQGEWVINKNFNPPIIFDSKVRIVDSEIFVLDANYKKYFDKFNPNAKFYKPDSLLVQIMKKYKVKFVPVLSSKNLELLYNRINLKGTKCSEGFRALINQFAICRINTTNCCDTAFVNAVTEELGKLKTKSAQIYSISYNKIGTFDARRGFSVPPCTDYRYIMNLGFLFRQQGGLGDSSNVTLVENELIDSTHIFRCSSNPWLRNSSTFKYFYSSIFNLGTHPLLNLSILFDNDATCQNKGLSPNAKINKVVLAKDNCTFSVDVRFNALLTGILNTPEYGVLLIEFGGTSNNDFAEVVKMNYDLIKLATECLNIIVVEPAGNFLSKVTSTVFEGNNFTTPSEWDPEIHDSGAIMVSGAETQIYKIDTSGGRKKTYRRPQYKFGDRIDCYSLCENICTNEGIHDGTSSASAIIAGMAVDIQSICKIKYGRFLNPTQMRTLFRKPTNRLVIAENCMDCVSKYIPTGDILITELNKIFLPCPPNCPPEK